MSTPMLDFGADGAMWRPDEPSLSVASKGLVSLDIVVTGARSDLHSGRYGGRCAWTLLAFPPTRSSRTTPDENLHAPDEFLRIARLGEGMRAWEVLWRQLTAEGAAR